MVWKELHIDVHSQDAILFCRSACVRSSHLSQKLKVWGHSQTTYMWIAATPCHNVPHSSNSRFQSSSAKCLDCRSLTSSGEHVPNIAGVWQWARSILCIPETGHSWSFSCVCGWIHQLCGRHRWSSYKDTQVRHKLLWLLCEWIHKSSQSHAL